MINGHKVIGIIGGMGPMAGADLFRKITGFTQADSDGGHIHILMDSNTEIPDRTEAIKQGSREPARLLIQSAQRLQSCGADVLVISCNTAHFFFDEVQAACAVPIINMPERTAARAAALGVKTVGLLATDGTVESGVYHRCFEACGIKVLLPDEEGQRRVMHLTYDEIKAGKAADIRSLFPALEDMRSRGAELFILGCTELPLAFAGCREYRFLDPTAVLAESAVEAAGYKVNATVQRMETQ